MIAIKFNAERKFRQIMIVHPVATDRRSFGLFTQMPVNFLQPIAEHYKFFFLHC
jgi:hypothetical protein